MNTETRIQNLEIEVRMLKKALENISQNVSSFARPAIRTAPDRITTGQIARAHGTTTLHVSQYHGIFRELKQFERRTETNRIYFTRRDYTEFLRLLAVGAEEIAAGTIGRKLKKRGRK